VSEIGPEIIHAVNVTENLDDLLRRIHQSLQKVLYAENCFIALNDRATGLFHFPFFVDKYDTVPPPTKLGKSCTAYVFRTGKAMLIPQGVFEDLVKQGEVELVGTNSPSWLGVPLRTPSETIGVLVVQHYEDEGAYTERDLEFLASVGGQIAVAIERKRAEKALRESEARQRVLIEQLPAVLWTTDAELRFTSALGAGLARLGLKPNQLVGMSLYEYFQTENPEFLAIAAHRRAIAGQAVTFQIEWHGGSYACHAEPLRSADGQSVGAICMALDVTDRKQLEAQLRQAQKMEAVGRLAGGIAHDFNNLLMVIQGYTELLLDRLVAGDPLRKNAQQIHDATDRAAALTRQLLAFSRKQLLAPKVLDLCLVVADMEKMLRRLIGEDIELATLTPPGLWSVKADRSQIEQVILNLAVNARDAMPRGGKLTIETANVELDNAYARQHPLVTPGKYVMLAVTDTGCGMDAETQAHIFEPFFTTKEKGRGTGLGLATVYGVVKQSGGYVWVYSEPDKGTTFKVYLPRVEEPVSAKERQPACETPQRGSETILLVEDEKGVRDLAREFLESNGYSVLMAENGNDAIDLVQNHPGKIDLLLTDVVMPGMSGRDLAERIESLRPGIKVLYMSGYTDQAIVHHGILDSDSVLLQKPFTLTGLARKLREALERPGDRGSGPRRGGTPVLGSARSL
jgi:PAS domain S-box-containing protein